MGYERFCSDEPEHEGLLRRLGSFDLELAGLLGWLEAHPDYEIGGLAAQGSGQANDGRKLATDLG